MQFFHGLLFLLLFWSACKPSQYVGNTYIPPRLDRRFGETKPPPEPDYANDAHWAALPWKKDFADTVPSQTVRDQQAEALVDVFFVHPTLYLNAPADTGYYWNADVNDAAMNFKIETSSILNQASVFNGSCRIFAPRYRQAHIYAYFSEDRESGQAALDLAYADVRSAFFYYLKHHNQGRPFIIASHSQGTSHCGRLLRDEIQSQPELRKQLVAAYLVGMPVPPDYFNSLPLCTEPGQTECFLSWCTFLEGYYPPNFESSGYDKAQVVNPIRFTTDTLKAPRSENKGGITWKYTKVVKQINGARLRKGMVWIEMPHVTGRRFIKMENFHVADYNLFWFNIRDNVQLRVNNYLKNKP